MSKIIEGLESKFGKISVTLGNKNDFLGVQLTFHKDGQLEIDMKSYLHSAIKESGMENVLKPVSMPARSNLFNIDENSPRLSQVKKNNFIVSCVNCCMCH